MFLDFYNLSEPPFGVTPDPRYLYPSPAHREALASLLYGIKCGRGFMTLIAKPGMGKTTLLFCLLEQLRHRARTAFLFRTQCDQLELLRHMLLDLGVDNPTHDVVLMHQQLNRLLLGEAERGRQVVVIIDEAQNLTDEALESVRLLSNFETPRAKLMQIILSGQPPLAEKLAEPCLLQFRQRLSIMTSLEPFSAAETERYINHRLRVAGYSGQGLFDSEAQALIAQLSEGIPRNINNLCFNALSIGCALRRPTIDAAMVREVATDLGLAALSFNGTPTYLADYGIRPSDAARQSHRQPDSGATVGAGFTTSRTRLPDRDDIPEAPPLFSAATLRRRLKAGGLGILFLAGSMVPVGRSIQRWWTEPAAITVGRAAAPSFAGLTSAAPAPALIGWAQPVQRIPETGVRPEPVAASAASGFEGVAAFAATPEQPQKFTSICKNYLGEVVAGIRRMNRTLRKLSYRSHDDETLGSQ
jgi:type II secretory pathway predicted ATPase ExeA